MWCYTFRIRSYRHSRYVDLFITDPDSKIKPDLFNEVKTCFVQRNCNHINNVIIDEIRGKE